MFKYSDLCCFCLPLFFPGQGAITQSVCIAKDRAVVFPGLQLYLSSHLCLSKLCSKRDVESPAFKQ